MMFKKINFNEYKQFEKSFDRYHFLSSSLWYKYQKIIFNNALFFAFFENKKPVILAKLIPVKILRSFTAFFVSYGPIINPSLFCAKHFDSFCVDLRSIFSKEKNVFIQFSPAILSNEMMKNVNAVFENSKEVVKSSAKFRMIDSTMQIDLKNDEQQIFQNFRKDAKYNIKRAQREGKINIKICAGKDDIRQFVNEYHKLQEKKHFSDETKDEYLFQMIKNRDAEIFFAMVDKKTVAGVLSINFVDQSTLITFLSFSTKEGQKLRAPSLLRWEIIRYAKKQGFEKVDFFDASESRPEIANFKNGFGGTIIDFSPFAYDLVLNKRLYNLWNLFRATKRFFSI